MRIASAAVGASVLRVRGWRVTSMHTPFNSATGGVFRVGGRALARTGSAPWTAVLKVIRASETTVGDTHGQAESDRWGREALVYESGVLDRLEGLRAPRCLGVDWVGDTTAHIWLEDVRHPQVGGRLTEHCRWVACRVGEFNGAHRDPRSLPGVERLGGITLRSVVAGYDDAVRDLRAPATDGDIQGSWPDAVRRRILRLWEERGVYLDALDRLPETFCHGDAFSRNLLVDAEHRALVAVDWSYAGMAPVGSELAPMVAASVFFGDLEPEDQRPVSEQALLGYLDGLRNAGWSGDCEAVRLGYAATAALRYGLYPLPDHMRRADVRQRLEAILCLPAEAILRRWALAAEFILDLADEARSLMGRPAAVCDGSRVVPPMPDRHAARQRSAAPGLGVRANPSHPPARLLRAARRGRRRTRTP